MIFIDVDGVLADFVGAALQRINSARGTDWKTTDVTSWSFKGILNSEGEIWKFTRDDGIFYRFWRDLRPYPWAKGLVGATRYTGREVAFLTTLPYFQPESFKSRYFWLEEQFGNLIKSPGERMIVTSRKDLVFHEKDIAIDDNPTNIKLARQIGAIGLALAQPWNVEIEDRMSPEELIQLLGSLGGENKFKKGDVLLEEK